MSRNSVWGQGPGPGTETKDRDQGPGTGTKTKDQDRDQRPGTGTFFTSIVLGTKIQVLVSNVLNIRMVPYN